MSGAITQAVHKYRATHSIEPQSYNSRAEGSCFGANESRNLFCVQLAGTHDGYGDWCIVQPKKQNELIIKGLFKWLEDQGLLD